MSESSKEKFKIEILFGEYTLTFNDCPQKDLDYIMNCFKKKKIGRFYNNVAVDFSRVLYVIGKAEEKICPSQP